MQYRVTNIYNIKGWPCLISWCIKCIFMWIYNKTLFQKKFHYLFIHFRLLYTIWAITTYLVIIGYNLLKAALIQIFYNLKWTDVQIYKPYGYISILITIFNQTFWNTINEGLLQDKTLSDQDHMKINKLKKYNQGGTCI